MFKLMQLYKRGSVELKTAKFALVRSRRIDGALNR